MSKVDIELTKFEEKTKVILNRVNGLTRDQIDWKLELPLGDDYWSVRQILAHLEEVNRYWIPMPAFCLVVSTALSKLIVLLGTYLEKIDLPRNTFDTLRKLRNGFQLDQPL